jgi:hypothetical protein
MESSEWSRLLATRFYLDMPLLVDPGQDRANAMLVSVVATGFILGLFH